MESTYSDPCQLLEWDSRFFGYPIAKVNRDELTVDSSREIDKWCVNHGVTCLYFLSRSDSANSVYVAEDNGFHFVDIRITLVYEFGKKPAELSENGIFHIRSVAEADVSGLKTIAGDSHSDTRFFYDLGFDRNNCKELYKTWIEASCHGYANEVLVATNDKEELIGYVTCHLESNSDVGKIGLLAVSKVWRGAGVGKSLIQGAKKWFDNNGTRQITVVTQGRNVASQRLYQRCGFLTKDVALWFHKWYGQPGNNERVYNSV